MGFRFARELYRRYIVDAKVVALTAVLLPSGKVVGGIVADWPDIRWEYIATLPRKWLVTIAYRGVVNSMVRKALLKELMRRLPQSRKRDVSGKVELDSEH